MRENASRIARLIPASFGNSAPAGVPEVTKPGARLRPPRIKNEEVGITGGRGLGALYVFAYHALASVFPYLNLPITITTVIYPSIYSFILSGCGIDFFFVLSAYLLTKKMTRGDYPSLGVYFAKRVFRIWPLFYVTIVAFTLVGLEHPSWLTFVFAMNYFPSTFENNQLWTLMIEELFYLALPLWIRLFVNGRMKYALPVLLLITSAYRIASPISAISFYDKQIPSYLFDYAAGTALGLSGAGVMGKAYMGRWRYALLPLFAVFATAFPNGYVWFSHPAFSIFYFMLIANFANSSVLTNRLSVYLGRISYPIFMFGTFIQVRLDSANFAGMFNLGNVYQAWEWFFLSLGLTIALAAAAHYIIERPGIAVGRTFIAKLKPA